LEPLAETARKEAADLHRFIEPLIRMCADIRDREYPVYPKPTLMFLRHIERLGRETQKFLSNFPVDVLKHSRTAYSKRQKLLSLRAGWEILHEYLRPALAADTLHLPTPLILTLQDKINAADNLRDVKFTLFHTDRANYLQVPSGLAREFANDIADLVGGTSFPRQLGLVGIPYSQGDGFFLNCLLPHEMAHFVYQEDAGINIEDEIDNALERMEKDLGPLNDEDLSLCRDTLRRWVEETFCDLFAICVIGPAYSFALIELTGASLLVGRLSNMIDDFYFFVQDHPAEIARFHSHYKLLNELGWWRSIENWSSSSVEVLKLCEQRSTDLHVTSTVPEAVGEVRLLQCYWEVCDWLRPFICSIVPSRSEDLKEFESQADTISEYLRRAVVPSTIIVGESMVHPGPVVLINAAFRFFLTSLSTLIENIDGKDKDSVADRSTYSERLELWMLKALEDYRLLTRQAT
jgi:hypothetical protein